MKTKLAITATCLSIILAPQIASATVTRITSYADLAQALANGHRVMVVGDHSKCKVKEYDNPNGKHDGMPDPDLDSIMGINFTSHFFLKYRDIGDKRYHILAVANNVGSYTDGTTIQRLKQIKIYDDNTAHLYAAAADFTTGKRQGHILSVCGISNGRDQNGLSIFDYDAEA
jgi:hypothetical protein